MIFLKYCRLAWLAFMLLAANVYADSQPEPGPFSTPQRIISLAPSTTEIVFSLGLGDRLVGVTRYCDYPPAVSKIAKIGGYVDPNYEVIVGLKPDLVVLLTSHQEARTHLAQLKVHTVTVPHKTIQDIHEAIRIIGDSCGKTNEAQVLISNLTQRTQAVIKAVEEKSRPRVLICIGRDTQSGQLIGIYAAGHEGFYDEIIKLAGGINAYTNTEIAYPQLSAEGIVQLNPDVIIDIVSEMVSEAKASGDIKGQWKQLSSVPAVQKNQIHIVAGNHALRPGPRYIEFLEQVARILHGEAFAQPLSNAERSATH